MRHTESSGECRVAGELLQRHDARGVVVEEVEGGGAVAWVDGVGVETREGEAFAIAVGGLGYGKGEVRRGRVGYER